MAPAAVSLYPMWTTSQDVSTVPTNGIETYYEQRGDGPPNVSIQGAIADHSQWAPQFEALSNTNI